MTPSPLACLAGQMLGTLVEIANTLNHALQFSSLALFGTPKEQRCIPMNFKKSVRNFVALSAGFALVAVSSLARAVDVTCVPDSVNSDPSSNITVYCNGNWYFAQPGICGNTVDSIKLYFSTVQAAILSGKTVSLVTPTDATCKTHIVFLQLNR